MKHYLYVMSINFICLFTFQDYLINVYKYKFVKSKLSQKNLITKVNFLSPCGVCLDYVSVLFQC